MDRALAIGVLSLVILASVTAQGLFSPSHGPSRAPQPSAKEQPLAKVSGNATGGKNTVGQQHGDERKVDASAERPFPAEALVSDSRGLWLSDWHRGKVARIDKGPIPRKSVLLPVIMYHNVRPIDFKTTNAFVSDLTLPPSEFELQLRYLKERGIATVSMEDLYLCLEGRRSLPDRSVVLTFDDGFENNYLYAMPLLKRYGLTGTFFLVSGLIGHNEYMTWSEAQEMVAAGMEIGSHTISHPDLARSAPALRDRELVESKRVLEEKLGVSVRALSYPSGAHNPDVMASARKAGYVIAVTTQYGTTQERGRVMELPRVRIHGTDVISGFRSRMEQIFPVARPATS